MATPKAQRIGIWIITVAMIIGVIGSFLVMILGTQNSAEEAKQQQDFMTKYQQYMKDQTAQSEEVKKDAPTFAEKYLPTLQQQKTDRVASYDAKSVAKLDTQIVQEGEGEAIGDDTSYAAYYIGWLPDGTVFDSSFKDEAATSLKDPFIVAPNGVIKGWTESLKGKKIGGVYELSIPAKDGYGAQSQGKIPANSPLKFIVIPLKAYKTIAMPQMPTGVGQ